MPLRATTVSTLMTTTSFLIGLMLTGLTSAAVTNYHITKVDDQVLELEYQFNFSQEERLLVDFLTITCDEPAVQIEAITPLQPAVDRFEGEFQKQMRGYESPATFHIRLYAEQPPQQATLRARYLMTGSKEPRQLLTTVPWAPANPSAIPAAEESSLLDAPIPLLEKMPQSEQPDSLKQKLLTACAALLKKIAACITTGTKSIEQLVSTTQSLVFRLFAIFALGVLMSMTPCIYPMIPITMGMLQTAHGVHTSLRRNFMLAASYTAGMSSTFAALGLITITFKTRFGQAFSHPAFLLLIALFLCYMGLSLLGLYDLYIPRFLSPRANHGVKSGSFISAYIFGAASGAFASPCLSPGLALVLSLAAKINSPLQALLLLFVFGIGSSLPLLIIGTFSASLDLLPRAGMWMEEVKKAFGLMLLAMAGYYLFPFVPATLAWLCSGLALLLLALYYLVWQTSSLPRLVKRIRFIIGSLALIGALLSFVQLYKASHPVHDDTILVTELTWHTDYEVARQLAQQDHKPLLLDFRSNICSLCTLIERRVFSKPAVAKVLAERYILVTVDRSAGASKESAELEKQFEVVGLPTILVVSPATQAVTTRWTSEFASMDIEAVVETLQNAAIAS